MQRLVVLLSLSVVACGAGRSQDEIAARITQFENRIISGVQIQGEPVTTATLVERMDYHGVPAVSVAVLNDGVIEWLRAYGMADVSEGLAATPSTLFQAASISKPVAATAALTLIQDGSLALDQDVNELLTGWKVPSNEHTSTEPVTLRWLLTHSAGMTVHGFPGYARDVQIPTTIQVLDGEGNTDPVRVDTTPGALWRYSGGGYTVMQLLVGELTGQPFPRLMAERVLEPFGMTLSTYEQPLPGARHAEAATAYRSDGSEVELKWHVYPEMAAAGLWTTPGDLARFAIGILDAYHGRSDVVLEQETAREMLTAAIGSYGLGPSIGAGGKMFGHGGSNEGYRCRFHVFIESGDGVAVMTNSDNGGALIGDIVQTLAELYDWPALKPEVREVVELESGVLSEFAGRYESSRGMVVAVELVDGRLWLEVSGEERRMLLPESDSLFFTRDDGTELTFMREAGRVVGFGALGTRFDRVRE